MGRYIGIYAGPRREYCYSSHMSKRPISRPLAVCRWLHFQNRSLWTISHLGTKKFVHSFGTPPNLRASQQVLRKLLPLNNLNYGHILPKPFNRTCRREDPFRIHDDNPTQRSRGAVSAVESNPCQFGHKIFGDRAIQECQGFR